jgi:glucokinase
VILAGDVGGTHARLALFGDDGGDPAAVEIYPSADHDGLVEIMKLFREAHPDPVTAATIGVAGPVSDGRTEAVNLAWPVDERELAEALELDDRAVSLINDLEANAWGIEALGDDDLVTLNEGTAEPDECVALISAGTGLGEAFITYGAGGARVHPSEGGHVNFAPRNELESELRDHLAAKHGHVSYERVCSGSGMPDVYGFLRERSGEPEPEWLTGEIADNGASAITQAGVERRDPVCSDALDVLVSAYGAQAGNLALTVLARGGVYLGGGIAPNIVDRLKQGGFMRAFLDKGRASEILEQIPVRVIENELTALLGAARHAQPRADSRA